VLRGAPGGHQNVESRAASVDRQVAPAGPNETTNFRLEFNLGLDGISLSLVLLTTLLTLSAVLVSWDSIRQRPAAYYACLLALEAGLLGAFCAFDVILFYAFFEFTLLPLFLLIGLWGGPERRRAAIRFFLYTLVGSLATLVGLVALVLCAARQGSLTSLSLSEIARVLAENPLPRETQWWLFLALAAGFLVKVPVFPFHTWLPLAHVEAPTAGSVMLAGALLKLGTYGLLRLGLTMLPDACLELGVPLLSILAAIGVVYGALCAVVQSDMKRLVAYSSISHLGVCVLGMFALNPEGLSGSVLVMVNHGLSTGALFLLVGMVYERCHTRNLDELGGLASHMPVLSCAMVFICLSSMGLPGLNGFVGELLSLGGMFKVHPLYAAIGGAAIVLGAWYLLSLLERGFFRRPPATEHAGAPHDDLRPRELAALAPIMVLCLALGLYPQPLLETIRPDIEPVARLYAQPRAPQPASERLALRDLEDSAPAAENPGEFSK
jgi:NADH-quinone oxidoreductase subunit M